MTRMRPFAQVQWIAAVLLIGSAVAACQSTLPPTAPTTREIDEQPANVEYANGQVAVLAENSSLNEIIRDVARRAGMAVKGSVIDERVYGTYGPAAPAEVLSKLLQGTGSNMLVLAGNSHVPELILTPKQGGPTPPRTIAEIAASEAEVDRGPDAHIGPDAGDAGPTKKDAEEPVQASTDSDKAGVSPEKASVERSDVQPDAKQAENADSKDSGQPASETPAQ
jgi:hypothetical protein